jgi:hypothetical protein
MDLFAIGAGPPMISHEMRHLSLFATGMRRPIRTRTLTRESQGFPTTEALTRPLNHSWFERR